MRPGAGTRVFALLGNPVAHSLSPAMHNAAFLALGLDAVYVALRCERDELPELLRVLARDGGGGNITLPHKAIAARTVETLDGSPLPICNTFWGRDGRVFGAETDSTGVLLALERLEAPRDRWLVIGTGGSAQAVLRAAARAGAAVAVRSRSPDRARAFIDSARILGVAAADGAAACSVVINCTPLGLGDRDPLPLAPELVVSEAVALDLVYRAGETAWVKALRERGIRSADGRDVLLGQGAAAFECWFPGVPAPLEVMGAALRAELG